MTIASTRSKPAPVSNSLSGLGTVTLSHFTLSRHYDATSAKPSTPYEGILTRVPRRYCLKWSRDKGSVAQCALLEAHRATEQGHSPMLAPGLLGWHHALCSYRKRGDGRA